jgi:hypothetical protein
MKCSLVGIVEYNLEMIECHHCLWRQRGNIIRPESTPQIPLAATQQRNPNNRVRPFRKLWRDIDLELRRAEHGNRSQGK